MDDEKAAKIPEAPAKAVEDAAPRNAPWVAPVPPAPRPGTLRPPIQPYRAPSPGRRP